MILLGVLVVVGGLILFGLVFQRLNELQREVEELRAWRDAAARRPRAEPVAPEPRPVAPSGPAPLTLAPPAPAGDLSTVVPPAPRPGIPQIADEPAPEPAVRGDARRALMEETALRRLGALAGEREPEPAPLPATEPGSGSGRTAEEVIGGIWLQNAGSLLLLLGVFFLILWGYTTGKFGPGVIVAAGVAFGAVLGWRGDRMARRVPAFGHALIGVGLGAAYISLYLGHFALSVLSPLGTTVLLALTSVAGILIGQRYRVQAIAVLAVIGAFVPQIAAILTGSPGFVDQPPLLLLYLAAIDVVVFVLAARSRWPLLALIALVLTAGTWISAVTGAYGWPVTWGLAALFVGLGLAPVRRLVRDPAPMAALDAAVVVLAPYLFAVAAWPFLAAAPSKEVGALCLGLAAIEAAAATFVWRKGGAVELWNVIVTAAAVFLTVALERTLGRTWTPMAWTVEGVVLTAVGVALGSGYLRLVGGLATALGVVAGLPALAAIGGTGAGPPLAASGPFLLFTANSVRALVVVGALFVGARVLERRRAEHPDDVLPQAWNGVAELMLFVWLWAHATRLAAWIVPGSGIPGLPAGGEALGTLRQTLMYAILAFAAAAQAFAAIARGFRRRLPHVRAFGYALALVACGVFGLGVLQSLDAWRPADGAFVHPVALFEAATLALFLAGGALAGRARGRLEDWERRLPEFLAVGLAGMTWAWLGVETAHTAHFLALRDPASEVVLAAAMVAFAWAVQAGVALALGVRRRLLHRRAIGYAVGVAAACALLVALAFDALDPGTRGSAVRNLAIAFELATLVLAQAGAARFGRARPVLLEGERGLPVGLSVLVSALTWAWLSVRAVHAASLLLPEASGAGSLLAFALVALAWSLQAAASLGLGVARGVEYRRTIGYVIAATAMFAFLSGLLAGWMLPVQAVDLPGRNLAAEVFVTTLACWLLGLTVLERYRDRLGPAEAQAPETLAAAFNLMLMLGSAQSLSYWSRAFGTADARRAAAVLTSGAWVVQAAALFLVGWRARSSFLRWLGLGLFGITLAKVALFDLAFVDVFWRFLIAIFFGAVLLAISYVYQRSRLAGRKDTLPT